MIHLDNVSKVYERADAPVRALDGVTLDVASGEFVAVRGPSGCGKTTLLMIVGGLTRPSSGRVVVASEDLSTVSTSTRTRMRARTTGFVFQMFHLLPYLTVLENVTVAAVAGSGAAARSRALGLLEKFRLGDRIDHRPAELSTGERQRVAVARALINRPQLILADEPTGNLDADSATVVLDLLSDFHREGGTVLLVTHEDCAAEYAQRTVVLQNGAVTA